MRIIAGRFRGTKLLGPHRNDEFRPTEDRTREALFNILGTLPVGRSFVDLYAGSGAVGLEAFSRGFAPVTLVEHHPRHLDVLRRNITRLTARLGPEERPPRVIAASVERFLSSLPQDALGVVFADPPWSLVDEAFVRALLDRIPPASHRVVVIEHASTTTALNEHRAWRRQRSRRYGAATLSLFFTDTEESR